MLIIDHGKVRQYGGNEDSLLISLQAGFSSHCSIQPGALPFQGAEHSWHDML